MQIPFTSANFLLPAAALDRTAFAVIACDQFTSQQDYWDAVSKRTEGVPSALQLICPEIYLKDRDLDGRIQSIQDCMQYYLKHQVFEEVPNAYFYVCRTLPNGKLRQGVVGIVDLEAYDFSPDSRSAIRASEKTIVDRIPPRARIRKNAPLELSHILLLADDPQKTLIEPLAAQTAGLTPTYDLELMLGSGHLTGYRLPPEIAASFEEALAAYTAAAEARCPDAPLVFAVGDGNHSLATAKAHWENLKQTLSPERLKNHPARYAMVELLNLYDETLEFEAVHRVLFQVDAADLWKTLTETFTVVPGTLNGAQHFSAVQKGKRTDWSILNPPHSRTVGTLQPFFEDYLHKHPGVTIDYIHGDDAVHSLCQKEDCFGFLLPAIQKEELFPSILQNGSLPLKSFSIGEAKDKRFYFEARKIR